MFHVSWWNQLKKCLSFYVDIKYGFTGIVALIM